MRNAADQISGYHGQSLRAYLASEDKAARKQDAIEAIESEIIASVTEYGDFGDGDIQITAADVWQAVTESLYDTNDTNAPKTLAEARERFDAAIKQAVAEFAEHAAPKVYAGRVRRWGAA